MSVLGIQGPASLWVQNDTVLLRSFQPKENSSCKATYTQSFLWVSDMQRGIGHKSTTKEGSVNRVYNFGAKNRFSKKLTDLAKIDTKVLHRYPEYNYKISAP